MVASAEENHAFTTMMQINKIGKVRSLVAVFAILMLALPALASASSKSVTWSEAYNELLLYPFPVATLSGYGVGLENPAVNVTYVANVINLDSGESIEDGSIIPLSTRLHFVPKGFAASDISWFGTGYSSDSPLGWWVSNAGHPGAHCPPSDQITGPGETFQYQRRSSPDADFRFTMIEPEDGVYVSLAVHPPSVNLKHSGTAQLECTDDSRNNCTVRSPGTLNSVFVFPRTFGLFYYAYRAQAGARSECFEHPEGLPMIAPPSPVARQLAESQGFLEHRQQGAIPFEARVPQQQIPFTFMVVDPNEPPTARIVGPTTGRTHEAIFFTLTATDPDGDSVRYGVDWDADDGNDTNELVTPANAYIPGATEHRVSKVWTDTGAKTIQVRAQDDRGSWGPWVRHTITLAAGEPPGPPAVTCGLVSASGRTAEARAVSETREGGTPIRWHYFTWDDGTVQRLSATGELREGVLVEPVARHNLVGVGAHTVSVVAEDGAGIRSAPATCTVTVGSENQPPTPPVFTVCPITLDANGRGTYEVTSTDPDGDRIRYRYTSRISIAGSEFSLPEVVRDLLPSGESDRYPWSPTSPLTLAVSVTAVAEDEYGARSDPSSCPGQNRLLVATNPATQITASSAFLNGTVTLGGHAGVKEWFRWSKDSVSLDRSTSELVSDGGAFSAVLDSLSSGTYYFRATARKADGGVVNADDILSFTIADGDTFLSDLVVSSLERFTSTQNVPVGEPMIISATVRNQGALTALASEADAYLNPSATLPARGNQAQNTWTLFPNDEQRVMFTFNTPTAPLAAGTYRVRVKADAGNVVAESNEANNVSAEITFTVGMADTDVCSNISGNQSAIPADRVRDAGGNCTCRAGTVEPSPSGGACVPTSSTIDLGLRYTDGTNVYPIAVQALGTTPTSPLRVTDGTRVYAVPLVAASSADATPIRFRTDAGSLALKRYRAATAMLPLPTNSNTAALPDALATLTPDWSFLRVLVAPWVGE